MELDRRVRVRVDRVVEGVRRKGFGSGYLVAPRLVLTAAHVVDRVDPDVSGVVTVTAPGMGEEAFPASVRWRQRMNDTVDAALIEVAEGCGWQVPLSLADLVTRPPQRYGLVIGTRPHPVTASGFPRMQKDSAPDGRRLDEQFTGRIVPGSGSLAGRYELVGTDPTFAGSDSTTAGGSRWSGMSGAAVLADDGYGGDLLCGVIRLDRQADGGGSRLTATPAAHLLADEAFRALLTEHTGWAPVLEPVEPAALLTPAAVDRNLRSPAALLRADAEAVAFHGRDSELSDLQAWCETDPSAVGIRVLTGPGGQGKTRLARRLTDALGWHGWATGHLTSDLTDTPSPDAPSLDAAPPDFTTLATSLPLLLVIDYAETRPRLVRRLVAHLHRSRHRVRVLLLARSDGPWRTDSLQAIPAVRDLLEEAPVVPLTPLIPTSRPAQDRRDAFHRAAQDLTRLLPLLPTLPPYDWTSVAAALRPPADLDDYRYDNVLTLQMTALVALLQHGPRSVDAAPGTPPERTLLKHEDRFWEASAQAPAYRLDLPGPTLGAAVAVAALCGAGTRDEALGVITTLPGLPSHQSDSAARWLASLYPSDGDRYWGSLQPDRIAEYHASRVLAEDGIGLPALLGASAPGQQAQVITVLARAAIAHYNAGRATDSEQVMSTLDTALDAAPLAYQAVETVTEALPYPSLVTAPLAIRLTTALADVHQQLAVQRPALYEPKLARSLSNLGTRLSEVGRRTEGLVAERQAVGTFRRLATSNPDYEPNFALSLSNLGGRLSGVGQRAEALAAAEEAVEIYRRLATDNPAAHNPHLAASLSNLGAFLSGVGRRAEALTTAEEAVEIYRRLAADNPAANEPNLATSLSNLGIRLSEVGRRIEAVPPAEQSVAIYRRLARDNPAAHEANLARSLSNLGTWLSGVGRQAEALTTAEEAVEIYRRLAADNPAAYEPNLAASLSNLGILLSEVGRRTEALTAEQHAVEIHARLAADNPVAHEPDLATSLSNLGIRLSEVGRPAEALAAAEQAVALRRRLAADNPGAHEPNLAASLTNLGPLLSKGGRHDEALTTAAQAVEIYRRLAGDNPAAHEPNLANSLHAWAAVQFEERQSLSGALRATSEAVEIHRRLMSASSHQPLFLSRLRVVLGLQAQLLVSLGRLRDARTVRDWLTANPDPADSRE
ncbi:tetratricopeptide repeat protein [Streptomyces sp. NPDC046465]|uniref:tetratricopeptide repeat protein n=1 Tax=Streptomyces sp. NPDC046465 TaxID=3155810 RepID=UPI00340E624D